MRTVLMFLMVYLLAVAVLRLTDIRDAVRVPQTTIISQDD
jgi:hypothetical protein